MEGCWATTVNENVSRKRRHFPQISELGTRGSAPVTSDYEIEERRCRH